MNRGARSTLRKRSVRACLVVLLILVSVVYAVLIDHARRHLTVTLINKLGAPIENVVIQDDLALGGVKDGASVTAEVPLTMAVHVRFRGPDGKERPSTYLFSSTEGIHHVLKITVHAKDAPRPGMKMVSVVILGTTVEYHTSL